MSLISKGYSYSMKTRSIGIGVIVAGVILLFANTGLFNMSEIVRVWWPVVFVLVGAYLLIDDARNNSIWAALLVLLGLFILVRNLGFISLDFADIFWPAIIIAAGVSILSGRQPRQPKTQELNDQDATAFLAGIEYRNRSKDFRSGKVTAILGGATLDMAKATIKTEATLTLFALMGGVELRIPENVVVKTRTVCILGSIEDTQAPEITDDAPVLYIDGTVLMGGVEIKRS